MKKILAVLMILVMVVPCIATAENYYLAAIEEGLLKQCSEFDGMSVVRVNDDTAPGIVVAYFSELDYCILGCSSGTYRVDFTYGNVLGFVVITYALSQVFSPSDYNELWAAGYDGEILSYTNMMKIVEALN